MTAPAMAETRFDRYGEIRLLGTVQDKTARKTWFVIKRKGAGKAHCVTQQEWESLSPTSDVHKLAPRLSIFGMSL